MDFLVCHNDRLKDIKTIKVVHTVLMFQNLYSQLYLSLYKTKTRFEPWGNERYNGLWPTSHPIWTVTYRIRFFPQELHVKHICHLSTSKKNELLVTDFGESYLFRGALTIIKFGTIITQINMLARTHTHYAYTYDKMFLDI